MRSFPVVVLALAVLCLSTLAFGQSATFEIQCVAKGSLGTSFNTATVTTSTPDPTSANNTDTVTTTVQGGTGRKAI